MAWGLRQHALPKGILDLFTLALWLTWSLCPQPSISSPYQLQIRLRVEEKVLLIVDVDGDGMVGGWDGERKLPQRFSIKGDASNGSLGGVDQVVVWLIHAVGGVTLQERQKV